jgi:hypothetical protein
MMAHLPLIRTMAWLTGLGSPMVLSSGRDSGAAAVGWIALKHFSPLHP